MIRRGGNRGKNLCARALDRAADIYDRLHDRGGAEKEGENGVEKEPEKYYLAPGILASDETLSGGAFKLLCVVGSLTWKSGSVKGNSAVLGELLGLRERQARRLVAELVGRGLLESTVK